MFSSDVFLIARAQTGNRIRNVSYVVIGTPRVSVTYQDQG